LPDICIVGCGILSTQNAATDDADVRQSPSTYYPITTNAAAA